MHRKPHDDLSKCGKAQETMKNINIKEEEEVKKL